MAAAVIPIVIGVLPYLGSIVTGIEHLFGHGSGKQKKDAAVLLAVNGLQAWASAEGKGVDASAIAADIEAAIESTVKLYNDLGVLLPHASAAPAK